MTVFIHVIHIFNFIFKKSTSIDFFLNKKTKNAITISSKKIAHSSQQCKTDPLYPNKNGNT